eukprot:scaffold75773_cov18-Tisochrysis_lutea.AAC.1
MSSSSNGRLGGTITGACAPFPIPIACTANSDGVLDVDSLNFNLDPLIAWDIIMTLVDLPTNS